MVENGVDKTKMPLWKSIMLGLVAGCYIGFGAMLMLNVGINCPGLATVRARCVPAWTYRLCS